MSPCIFCNRSALEILAENDLAFAIRDKYPVRQLHTLILPKRHEADGLEISTDEIVSVFDLTRQLRLSIAKEDPNVGGFNFGLNNGNVAGQKIMHAHFHLIPRRTNEAPPPAAQA